MQIVIAVGCVVIIGAAKIVNVPAEVAVPLGVVTLTTPVVPAPTVAVIEVEETTVKVVTLVAPIVTAVAPVKLVPVIVKVVLGQPLVGVKLVIVGNDAAVTFRI